MFIMERPKVRFSQISENNRDGFKASEANDNRNVGKVKIKSIVPTNFPIKVLKNGKCVLVKKTLKNGSIPPIYVSEESNATPYKSHSHTTNNNSTEDCIDKLHYLSISDEINRPNQSQVGKTVKNVPSMICKDDNEDDEVEIIKVVTHSSKSNNVKNNHKEGRCITKASGRRMNQDVEVLGVYDHTTFKGANKSKVVQNENKENRDENSKQCRTSVILNDATNLTGKNAKPTIKGEYKKKPPKLELMPCAKYRLNSVSKQKYNEKLSKNQVKKSAVLNVTGKCPDISIQPGMSYNHKKTHSPEIDKTDCRPKHLLSQPIYNSLTYAMKRMKKVERERLTADFEHLPQANKNLINSKVSSALDFAPYESVYKDLINLSIEENKLPPMLMRSRDPEPRDKDFVPELSDFYNPKCAQENFVIADPIIINPVNVNTLSAFTISNKICTWKN